MMHSPVAIGGVGGSGTRLFASILKRLGYYLGGDLNEADDNLWFTLLMKRQSLWPIDPEADDVRQAIRVFETAMTGAGYLTREDGAYLDDIAFASRPGHPSDWLRERVKTLKQRCEHVPNESGSWAWKEPNTHLWMPTLAAHFSQIKYIHVLRHGLDMAFSANQYQLEFWGAKVLGRRINPESAADSLAYWCAVHKRILPYIEAHPENCLLINYDEFCHRPGPALGRLLEFLGVDPATEVRLAMLKTVAEPEGVGRFRRQDLSVFDRADLEYVRSLGFEVEGC